MKILTDEELQYYHQAQLKDVYDTNPLRQAFVSMVLTDFDNPRTLELYNLCDPIGTIDGVVFDGVDYFIRHDRAGYTFTIRRKDSHSELIVWKDGDKLYQQWVHNHDEYIVWARWYNAKYKGLE